MTFTELSIRLLEAYSLENLNKISVTLIMLMNPIFPDAQPYDTNIIIVIAAFVVWVNRKTMFSKEGAITRVIPLTGTT